MSETVHRRPPARTSSCGTVSLCQSQTECRGRRRVSVGTGRRAHRPGTAYRSSGSGPPGRRRTPGTPSWRVRRWGGGRPPAFAAPAPAPRMSAVPCGATSSIDIMQRAAAQVLTASMRMLGFLGGDADVFAAAASHSAADRGRKGNIVRCDECRRRPRAALALIRFL